MDDNTQRYQVPESDDALLAECEVDTFRAGGPGGQHQNVTDSGVRLRHRPSGLQVTCRQDRSQHQNKRTCLRRLRRRLLALQETPPERLPTQPPTEARERRLADKTRQAAKKRSRRAPDEPED